MTPSPTQPCVVVLGGWVGEVQRCTRCCYEHLAVTPEGGTLPAECPACHELSAVPLGNPLHPLDAARLEGFIRGLLHRAALDAAEVPR